jgi:hypothetical protein
VQRLLQPATVEFQQGGEIEPQPREDPTASIAKLTPPSSSQTAVENGSRSSAA